MRVIESFEDDVQVIERTDGLLRFRWVKAPSSSELTHLTETLAPRSRRNSRAVSSGWDCRCFRAMASQEARRIAEQNGDDKGLKRAEQELKEAGTTRDELDLFRKNLQSFVRAYEFLSQIVHFDDVELEQLCVYAKHLHPLLRMDRLLEEDPIDVSELELTHYRLTKREEKRLQLEEASGDYGLTPVSDVGSGKPFDPEKQRLAEIIDRLNDIFGSEVGDDDQLHYAQGIANRLERDDSLMAQLDQHDEAQLMHGMFPKKVTDAVLDALSDHEKLSMPLLEDEDTGRQFALLIPKLLAGRSGRDSQTGK